MTIRRPSIRGRLTLIAAAAVAATALIVCGLAWVALRQTLIHQTDEQLRTMANGPVGGLDPAGVRAIPNTPLTGPAGIRVQILVNGGRAVTAPPNVTPLPVSAADLDVVSGRTTQALYTTETSQGRFRVLTRRGGHGETVQLARSLADNDATLRQVGVFMVALTIAAAAVAAVAGRVVAGAGLAPVNRLTRAASRIAETQDLRHPIPIVGHDEVAQLGHAFNSMLTALARSQRQQQELIQDAAHELRTPMASMRTNIDLLIHAGTRLSPADRDALIGDLHGQSVELSDLVADLVDLARTASVQEAATSVDLADLVATAAQRAKARAPAASIDVRVESAIVVCQPAAVERAVINLIDNAVKFGTPADVVDVSLTRRNAGGQQVAEISVADRNPTIPEAEREKIFQRFHRLEAAWSVPGSGLGLAIVHQTAVGHGGGVTVEARDGGGNVFRLRLPADAPDPGSEA